MPPAYAGPTPANPFGGASAFDIFDAIEQAEQERAMALTARAATLQDLPTEQPPQPVAVDVTEAVPEVMADAALDTLQPAAPAPVETAGVESDAIEPMAATEALPEPALLAAPMVVPVLVGDAEPAEKKRGWWKR